MLHDVISIKGQTFNTLVADTPEEHERGLMWQEWPPPIMTFPYNDSSYRKFWMKNTVSPLDIIFCNDGHVIGIFKGEPLSTSLIGPNEASNLVIELPAGTAEKIGIEVGDYVGFGITG